MLAVVRCLDEAAGGALLDAASAPLDTGPDRIDVDLRALDSFTDAGARALVGCRDLGAKLPEGLHYRTGRGPAATPCSPPTPTRTTSCRRPGDRHAARRRRLAHAAARDEARS